MAHQPKKPWFVYLVKCADGTLYCGATNDLEERIAAHNAGAGARYTRGRAPVELVFKKRLRAKPEAMRAEVRIKRLSRRKKLALTNREGTALLERDCFRDTCSWDVKRSAGGG